jgi:Domain of unknown function (DUF4275)
MAKKSRFGTTELAVSPGAVLRSFDEQEARQWSEKWMAVYVGHTPVSGIRQYLWHTFSAGNYPAVTRAEAERLYESHQGQEILVLSSDRGAAVLTNSLPTWCSRADYCVFPLDLAWTMAFTHEAGWLGPYFAKHPNYEAMMEKARQQRLAADRKALELSRAKQKGWI